MLKSFALPRPLPAALQERLRALPHGDDLAANLQAGLRAHVLGVNPVLLSAVANDIPVSGIGYAQELNALARPGDVLLGISTSGRARNVLLAVTTAKALGLTTIGLTGRAGNALATSVDIAMCVPEVETYRVQELHLVLYHQLCLMVEAHFFGGTLAT
ncbi:MAG: D-sedoheptulose-7-phosphate isomerase [Anaerolineae bacterium]